MGILDIVLRPDPARFARLMTGALRRAGERGSIEYDDDTFCLVINGSQRLNLGNAFDEYRVVPFLHRRKLLRWYAVAVGTKAPALPTSFEDARESLLPRLRERMYVESLRLQRETEGIDVPPFPSTPFGESFCIELVFDLPTLSRSVSEEELKQWDVPFDECLRIAVDNLWSRSNQRFDGGGGLYASSWHDTYDATRLILPNLVWQLEVKGQHVAMVPNRDVLLVTGDQDEAGLARLAVLAEKVLEGPRPMSGTALRLQSGRWVPWVPPQGHAAEAPFRRLAMKSIAREYAEQKGLLERLYEKRGEDVFVGAHNLMSQRGTDNLFSYCTWSDGVDSLLPRAERVGFCAASADGEEPVVLGLADWSRVLEVAGHRMEACEAYPERWRVRDFPTQEELGRMDLQMA